MVEAGNNMNKHEARGKQQTTNPESTKPSNPMLDCNLSTVIPLNSNKICQGLGPERIEDLALIKEDVGLKEPIVVKDYPSPSTEQIRYEGAKILPTRS